MGTENSVERIMRGLAKAEGERKTAIEKKVSECDGLAKKLRTARLTLESLDVVAFEDIRKATEDLRQIKMNIGEKKAEIMKEIQDINDQDFKALIDFHFKRIDG